MKVGDIIIEKSTGKKYYYLAQGDKHFRINGKAAIFFHSVDGGNDFLEITRQQLAADYELSSLSLRQPELIEE